MVITHHLSGTQNSESRQYLRNICDSLNISRVSLSIMDFTRLIKPFYVLCAHYSGAEDEKYYGMKKLTREELSTWITESAMKRGVNSVFEIPQTSDE